MSILLSAVRFDGIGDGIEYFGGREKSVISVAY